MEKNVTVTDVFGNQYGATWPKRARGLVKNGRARFVDDHTICLACPPDEFYSEDFFMNNNMNENEVREAADELREKAAAIDMEAESKAEEAADLREEAADLREEANDLRTDAEDVDADADDLHAEADEMDKDADGKDAEADEIDAIVKKLREEAKIMRAEAARMCDFVGKIAGEAGDRVKAFAAEHEDEIDAAKAIAAEVADKAKEAAKIAADKTKEAARAAWASAKEWTSEFERAAAEATPGYRDADAPEPEKTPAYTMEYILGQLEKVRRMDNAPQAVVLNETYTKMYEDLRDREHREKLQKIAEAKAMLELLDPSYSDDFREKMFLELTAELRAGR